jgi:ABC-2 type transport system ATP-binding protein
MRAVSTAIACRGLVKRYGTVTAVDGLDLEVCSGECLGLLGPNGAGKTTTVEILEGLIAPDAGVVEVLGQRWERDGRELRQRLGIQLQETLLPEKLTALEVLTLFRSFYTQGAEPGEVLRQVGLEEKAGTWVRKLSGGQQQRLSLACALVSAPEILFLDEPTTGLDPQARRSIWDIVAEFRQRGGTVLLTTHYMEEAERLCDRVAILDHGRAIAAGTPAELIGTLGAEHVVEFEIEQGSVEEPVLAALAGVRAVAREEGAIRLTVSEVHRAIPALLDELKRQGVTLSRLTTHHASLEDVFVGLTGRHLRDN